jgi:SsrA-binding protein
VNMTVAEYKFGSYANHEPKRVRKLLLNSREIKQWHKKVNEKGLTIVPTLLFLNENGLAKLNISLAQGKKIYDKRDTLRDKDTKRQLDRLKKLR